MRAVGRANTAAHSVESLLTLGVEQTAPLIAVFELIWHAGATTVRLRLVAESAVVAEMLGAVLPADRAVAFKAGVALGVAQRAVLVQSFGAHRHGRACRATIGTFPASLAIMISEVVQNVLRLVMEMLIMFIVIVVRIVIGVAVEFVLGVCLEGVHVV